MRRPAARLVPPCAKPYKRHAFDKNKRRAPTVSGQVRRCIHDDCTASQIAHHGPARAHSTLLWYWQRSRSAASP